jgi:CBS domain-containing membrane protein
MRNVCFQIVRSWGTKSGLNIAEYLWILSMFGVLAGLEDIRIGLFLIPPFGATLTILIDLPQASVAQPYALVAGSVVGASVGTLLSLFSRGSFMAILAAVLAFGIINLIHAYHRPVSPLLCIPCCFTRAIGFP